MAHSHLVGIHADEVLHSGIHLHLPDGATPKDGPSAGIAIMCAMASLLKGKPLPSNLALTGEITLRGQVLGVGGIREKLTAAYRSGCHTVIIPAANERDLVELPREIRSGLQIIPVRSMLEVIHAVGLGRGVAQVASSRKRMTLIAKSGSV
jgi:ATP-dependent Lon protease